MQTKEKENHSTQTEPKTCSMQNSLQNHMEHTKKAQQQQGPTTSYNYCLYYLTK